MLLQIGVSGSLDARVWSWITGARSELGGTRSDIAGFRRDEQLGSLHLRIGDGYDSMLPEPFYLSLVPSCWKASIARSE